MPTFADDPSAFRNDYNNYPNWMVELCVASYNEPMSTVVNSIPKEWSLVWGPAQLSKEDESYSRAFIVRRQVPSIFLDEYTVVIRGTNFKSWDSWMLEDFDVHKTEPLSKLVPEAPAGARIAQGTYNGIHDLNNLTDPVTGKTMVQFLQQVKPPTLYVTGHSLGGTLTPVYFAYLNSVLFGGGRGNSMALWSFAGLTPGNADFNAYLTSLGNPEFPWRLFNTLDIAPNLFGNRHALDSIYLPTKMDLAERLLIDGLFLRAKGNGYEQPAAGATPLKGWMQKEKHFKWAEEAMYQHHSTTYQLLVQAAYPVRSTT
ncbi:MAG TPA: hypothetical protein VGF48_03010 [Thermoanaerobaculia bacterium]|jgi:hypothetical protein